LTQTKNHVHLIIPFGSNAMIWCLLLPACQHMYYYHPPQADKHLHDQ